MELQCVTQSVSPQTELADDVILKAGAVCHQTTATGPVTKH